MEKEEVKEWLLKNGFKEYSGTYRKGFCHFEIKNTAYFAWCENVEIIIETQDLNKQKLKELSIVCSDPFDCIEYATSKWDMFISKVRLHKSFMSRYEYFLRSVVPFEYMDYENDNNVISLCCDLTNGNIVCKDENGKVLNGAFDKIIEDMNNGFENSEAT